MFNSGFETVEAKANLNQSWKALFENTVRLHSRREPWWKSRGLLATACTVIGV